MYLTEYWNDDDDEDEIVIQPHLHEPLKSVSDFEQGTSPTEESPESIKSS